MATEAEKVVVELLAKVDGFDGKVKQSAAAFGGAMKKVEDSASRAEQATTKSLSKVDRSLAQTAQRSRNLGFQISDIGTQLAGGTSPFLILAQQGPQVANALDGAGGAVGRFAGFLSSWQGALVLAAVTLAAQFIPKLLETGDAVDDLVDKLKEEELKTRDSEKANDLFGRTLEGVEKAARLAVDAVEKLRLVKKGEAEQTVDSISKSLDHADALREEAKAALDRAKVILGIRVIEASQGANNPDEFINRELEQSRASQVVKDLEDRLKRATSAADSLRRSYTAAVSARTVAETNISAEDAINRKYDLQIDRASAAANASAASQRALAAEVRAINKARDAEVERNREAQRAARSTAGASLPKVTQQEVARLIGAPITSGTRTAARNKAVGGADNSYHLTGQAIDIPLTVNGKPLTKAGIRAALEPAGVIIKELLGPGDKGHSDHFHVAFDKKRGTPDQIANAQQKAQDDLARAAEEELRRRQSFENELANLQGSEIDARQALIASAEEIAQLETQAIEISRKKYDDNLDSLVEQKKLTAEEASQLRSINDERAKLRTELVQRREDQRKFRIAEADAQRKLQFASDSFAVQTDLLQSQEGIAKTARQRRALEDRLIQLHYDEEKLQLQAIIAKSDRLKIELDRLATLRALSDEEKAELELAQNQAEIANKRLGTIDERKGNDQQRNSEQNAGPLQSFMQDIPNTADEINQAFESVAAGGLATFTDALTDAIVNFRSLGDVGRAVLQTITAGLVKMAIQQIILNTIGKSLGLAATATTSAAAATSAAAWAPAAALASLATLGANAGPAAAALATTTALAAGLALTGAVAKKDGGPIYGPGTGTSDDVPIWASNGEFMIKQRSAAKLGRGALEYINRTGELPYARAEGGPIGPSIRPRNGAAATRGGPNATLDEASLRRIESAVERGAAAQLPVNLYPTMSPQAAMQAMLSDPGAQRVMFDWMTNNSGSVNGRLAR